MAVARSHVLYGSTSQVCRKLDGAYWVEAQSFSCSLNPGLGPSASENLTAEEMKLRSMIEKKTVINLLEAYAVAVKHYLRGEDGIYYQCVHITFLAVQEFGDNLGIPEISITLSSFCLHMPFQLGFRPKRTYLRLRGSSLSLVVVTIIKLLIPPVVPP